MATGQDAGPRRVAATLGTSLTVFEILETTK